MRHYTSYRGTFLCSPADARHMVDSLKAAGADMIKLRYATPTAWYAAAAEPRRIGIPFGGHHNWGPPNNDKHDAGGLEASDSGALILDHSDMLTRSTRPEEAVSGASLPTANVEQCRQLAERLRRNGTWMVPTLGHPSPDGPNLRLAQQVGFPLLAGAGADQQGESNGAVFAGLDEVTLTPTPAWMAAAHPELNLTVVNGGSAPIGRMTGLP